MENLSYKTYADLLKDIKKNITKIPANIDLIVGVPRSGMIPAYMIGVSLNKPVCSIDEFTSGIYKNKYNLTRRFELSDNIKNILIIDDSVNSGFAITKIKDIIKNEQLDKKFNIIYGAVYYCGNSNSFVDFAMSLCPQPRMFQWNYLNHYNLKNAALDMDGVLCIDPTKEENDDGEKYKSFILNARPLYIPKYKVAAIVTSRLGKYRKETEIWLKNNNVEYGKLYMLENKTAEQRRHEQLHAKHKASIYKQLEDCNLFIESEPSQAKEIQTLTGKLCFCSKTDELFRPDSNNAFKKTSHPKVSFIKRLLACFVPIKKLRRKIRGQK